MEANAQKRVAIPAQYVIVHGVAIAIFLLGAGALFLKFRDALISALPWLGHPAVAWTLFIVGTLLLVGNQLRLIVYITRARQRARTATP
jgi:hypothetical protein